MEQQRIQTIGQLNIHIAEQKYNEIKEQLKQICNNKNLYQDSNEVQYIGQLYNIIGKINKINIEAEQNNEQSNCFIRQLNKIKDKIISYNLHINHLNRFINDEYANPLDTLSLDEKEYKVLGNYKNICTSVTKFNIENMPHRNGIINMYGTKENPEYNIDLGIRSIKFVAPFEINSFPRHSSYPDCCSNCGSMWKFVDSFKQIFSRYAYLYNPTGWLCCNTQYYCDNCKLFTLFTEKLYSIVHSGYYDLHISPVSTLDIDIELKTKVIANPTYKFDLNTCEGTNWNEKCFICHKYTQPYYSEGYGCITGKRSLCSDSVCVFCMLRYHTEEHDD